jgi:hypothetical protein
MVFAHQPGEAEEDTEGIQTAVRFADNVAQLILKIKG